MPLFNFKWFQEIGKSSRYQELKVQNLKAKLHPLNHRSPRKKPYPSVLSINPQTLSPFFTRLPLEIRLIIYEFLFGHRSLHYQCDWLKDEKKWLIHSYCCYSPMERVDWDHCAGNTRSTTDIDKALGLRIDISVMFSCWKAYTEGLQVLYGTNEFRFSEYQTMCKLFPRQIPAQELANIRYLTFWWSLKTGSQPHLSQKKNQYDEHWTALKTKFVGLTHIRIFIDTHGLAYRHKLEEIGENVENKQQYIQQAWLDGIESLVGSMGELELFELHVHRDVYRFLRERVKPWLKQKEEERKKEKKTDRISYKAYKCRDTAILYSACPPASATSVGSSYIGIEDPRSQYGSLWWKKIKELEKARKRP